MLYRRFCYLVLILAFFSCGKDKSTEPTVESVKNSLTGGLTKTWTLNKLFINGVQSTLTPGQARFTKTYKVNNTWLDSDGYVGTYVIPNVSAIIEETTNLPSGPKTDSYSIKLLSSTMMEIEYTISSTNYRLVFGL